MNHILIVHIEYHTITKSLATIHLSYRNLYTMFKLSPKIIQRNLASQTVKSKMHVFIAAKKEAHIGEATRDVLHTKKVA